MLGTNKNTEKFILNMSSYIGGVLQQSFDLTKSKLLIGSFEGADICIQNDQTSYYHALIVIDSNGEGDIRDLSSKNGIFINGEKTDSGHFSSGDVIAIGSVEFHITERPSSSEVINTDQNVKSIIIEMTSAPNELPPKDGLTLIDGEYCDISFDERNFSGENLEEINSVDLSIENYVDLDESIVEEHKNIILNDMSDSVEVTILSNGTIIDLHHLPVKNRTYYASGNHIERRNTVTIPGLETDKKVQFISIKDGKIIIHDIDRFFKVDSGVSAVCSSSELLKGDIQTFTYGINQIILRVTKSPAKLKVSPFFYQDKEMLKQAGKVFGVAISLMLLLLLVDTTPERPEPKKLSIIYKKAVNASTHSDKKTSTRPDKVDLDKGIKKDNQKPNTPKFAKKQNILLKTNKKKNLKKAPAKQKRVAKALKVKQYKFKSKSFTALLGSSKNIKQVKLNTKQDSTLGNESTLTASTSNLKTTDISAVGKLGRDSRGNESTSYGAKGLASKRGIDTAYVAPKTVVLGSMDPELLRKILREYLPQFKHCYQEELESYSENIKGVVNLDFRIGAAGRVISSSINARRAKFSKKGVGCMNKVLRLIEFPKPKGGGVVDVRQPLNFFSERTKY